MLRIGRIEVDNFKSLVGFEADLPKFACLIGLNGSGKSTVLQFLDFLSQLVRGDMRGWLEERRWKPGDLRCKLTPRGNIKVRIRFSNEDGRTAGSWNATYNPTQGRCTREDFHLRAFSLQVRGDEMEALPSPWEGQPRKTEITFDYQGSILSALKEDQLPASLLDCKAFLRGIKSLDLLAPERLRQRTRESSGTLGLGGQHLSSFLHELSSTRRQRLLNRLQEAYPRLRELNARSIRSGWKQIEIAESYEGDESETSRALTTEAQHINDGMLRLIAILAELQSDNPCLLFDEIENGINPELVQFLINELASTPKQVLVTTHSPMILNYLDDETARRGVIYLYKTRQGFTRAIPFFSIPSVAEKLTVMGPGEAFADTSLTELADEIAGMPEGNP